MPTINGAISSRDGGDIRTPPRMAPHLSGTNTSIGHPVGKSNIPHTAPAELAAASRH